MIDQEIFKGLGSNWKWASISETGVARVHIEKPESFVGRMFGDPNAVRVPEFDVEDMSECLIGQRTDFSNGPDYPTDSAGNALVSTAELDKLYPSPQPGWIDCTTVRPVLQPLTAVNLLFPNCETVKGVKLSPKDWGSAVAYQLAERAGPSITELVEKGYLVKPPAGDVLDMKRSDPLTEAKNRAIAMTCRCDQNGQPFLSLVQYMAIFGELPE